MKKLVVILMALMLAACSSKEAPQPEPVAPEETGPVVLDHTRRILVLPFSCNILPQENASTTAMLQNQLSAQIVYMMQSAGIPSEQYVLDMNEGASAQPASYASLLPTSYGPGGGGLPLPGKMSAADEAATSFEEVTDWDTVVVPPRDTRQFGTPMMGYMAVGDTEYVPVPADVQPQQFEQRDKILKAAKEHGYDYVLAGTIALVRTDVSPTVEIAGTERATLRSEINCAFQLLDVNSGNIGKHGASRGRDAKMVVVKDSKLNSYHLYSALDKVMQQATFYTAKRVAEQLTEKRLDDSLFRDEREDEANYYQDSPGKRLRTE